MNIAVANVFASPLLGAQKTGGESRGGGWMVENLHMAIVVPRVNWNPSGPGHMNPGRLFSGV